MSDDNTEEQGPSWKNRRRVIFSSLILCAFLVIYVMIFGEDTRVNESIVLGSFALASAIISAYVFGSVWQDNTKTASGKHTGKPVSKPPSIRRGADSPDA